MCAWIIVFPVSLWEIFPDNESISSGPSIEEYNRSVLLMGKLDGNRLTFLNLHFSKLPTADNITPVFTSSLFTMFTKHSSKSLPGSIFTAIALIIVPELTFQLNF